MGEMPKIIAEVADLILKNILQARVIMLQARVPSRINTFFVELSNNNNTFLFNCLIIILC